MSSPGTTNKGPAMIGAETFRQISQRFSEVVQPTGSNTYSADGGYVTYNLPKTGLGYGVSVLVTGQITIAGTVTGGTFAYNAPWTIIKQRTFGPNGQTLLRNVSGWSNYLFMRERIGRDISRQNVNDYYSANNLALLGVANVTNPIVPKAALVAQTYNIAIMLPMDLAYTRAADLGLLCLQTYDTVYQDQLQWGQLVGGITSTGGSNDLFNGLTGTGLSVTVANLQVASYSYEYFAVPTLGPRAGFPNGISLNNLLSNVLIWAEMPQLLLASTNQVQLPKSERYTIIMGELVNSSGPLVGANAPSNIALRHNGAIYVHQDNYPDTLERVRRLTGEIPVDGCITYDLGASRQFTQRRDTDDAFNDTQTTQFELDFSLPSGYVSGGSINMKMESLRTITPPSIAL